MLITNLIFLKILMMSKYTHYMKVLQFRLMLLWNCASELLRVRMWNASCLKRVPKWYTNIVREL